jgi:hypothetical protein
MVDRRTIRTGDTNMAGNRSVLSCWRRFARKLIKIEAVFAVSGLSVIMTSRNALAR